MAIEPRIIEFMTPAMVTQAPYLDPAGPFSPAERRAALAANHLAHFSQLSYPTYPNVVTSDLDVPGSEGTIRLRLFHPNSGGPWPAYLFFFGGAFWQGSFDGPDIVSACQQAASEAQVLVAEIDYPLAPEHPYPAALDAGVAALNYLADHATELGIRPDRLAVGGQSSGANLAAATALWVRDHGGPSLAGQILEVPALNLAGADLGSGSDGSSAPGTNGTSGNPSAQGGQNAQADSAAAGPEVQAMLEILDFYGVTQCASEPYVSPLLAKDLSGLPKTLILAAENDPLAADAVAYCHALQAAGVDAVQVTYGGQIHASPALSPVTASATAWRAQVSQALRDLHN